MNTDNKKTKTTTKKAKATNKKVNTKLTEEQEIVKKEILESEDELILDVTDIKPIVKQEDNSEEELLDVFVEEKNDEVDSEKEVDFEKESEKEDKANREKNEKEFDSLPKVTLNELRTIKRNEKKSEELEKEKIEELKEMPTVNENPIQLSKQAQNWKDWLEYQKIKPEDFIRKYPEHKYISFIKEIIQNNSK